jgi:hypothetical protein
MIGQNKPFQANSGGLLGGKSTGTTIPQAKANIGGPLSSTISPIPPAAIQTSKPTPLSAGGKLNDGQKPPAKLAQPKPLPPTQAPVPFKGVPSKPMPSANDPLQAKWQGPSKPQGNANAVGSLGFMKPPIPPAVIQAPKPTPPHAGGKFGDTQKPPVNSGQTKPLPPSQAPPPSQGVSTKPIAAANNPLQTKGQTPPKPQDKDKRAFFGMFGGRDNKKPTVPASQDGRKIPQEKKTQPGGGIFGSSGSGNKSSTRTSNQNGSRGGAAGAEGATNFGKPEYKKQGPNSVMTDSKGKGKPPAMPKVAPKAKADNLIVYVDGKRTIL